MAEKRFHQVVTVNPEFILQSRRDDNFRTILNESDLNVADGFGIQLAFWRLGGHLKCRFAGADLMWEVLRKANEKNLSIFLAAKKGGLSSWEKTREEILKVYPGLEISGASFSADAISNTKIVADIVFVNFGAPDQEKFIKLIKNDRIKLAMGVGGSFDFVTGKVKRAPKFMRKIGLEWLWRFILEPKYRFKRIFQSVIVFPIKILLNGVNK